MDALGVDGPPFGTQAAREPGLPGAATSEIDGGAFGGEVLRELGANNASVGGVESRAKSVEKSANARGPAIEFDREEFRWRREITEGE